MTSPSDPSYLLPRGVHRAPCLSHNGDRILFAVDHRHRLLDNGWSYLAPGENPFPINERLWARLNEEDPMPESAELPQAG